MISIQTNIAALYGQQNFQTNSNFEQNTIEQLTSGYRINSSADDAAGLAVANQLHSQETELNQGVSNASNGVSQLQIIDGGLTNITQILNRLQTLATQAASTTFTGNFDTLNNEFQADIGELNRQASNIGLNTGGDFNSTLSVFVGGGIGVSDGEQIGTAVENMNLGNISAFYGSFSVTGTVSGSFSFASTASATGTGYSATNAGNVAVAMSLAGTGYTMTGNALAATVTVGTASNSYTSTSVSALFTQTGRRNLHLRELGGCFQPRSSNRDCGISGHQPEYHERPECAGCHHRHRPSRRQSRSSAGHRWRRY